MSEYKTLKELLGELASESKGRKFITILGEVFEPRFLLNNNWYGVINTNDTVAQWHESTRVWKEWHPPKKLKTVTLYKPLVKGYDGHVYSPVAAEWHTDKANWSNSICIGWMSKEAVIICED